MALSEKRLAADGIAYTYAEFVQWYGTHAGELWERAAATEHSDSVDDRPRDATEHSCGEEALPSYAGNTMISVPSPACSPASIVKTETVDDFPRDATEHSACEKSLPPDAGNTSLVPQNAHELALVPMPPSSVANSQATEALMQCVNCERPLCGREDLAFFRRANKQGGIEVHLMLRPENQVPATLIRSPVTEKGAMASWQCTCGFKLGHTRAVAVKRAAMTAFKSSSVILFGQRFNGRKSQWPSIYNQFPFNTLELRSPSIYHDGTEHAPQPRHPYV